MRIDIVTIFPEFFQVLDVSLLGKARESGLISTQVHNLRDVTTDKHKTVDDSPYGGGAGMVMMPEPWGLTLDEIFAEGNSESVLVIPSPAGKPFTQEIAKELALKQHLVFACGRYEGIDQRVSDFYSEKVNVIPLSLGDYVLNGGEVASLAIIEAVTRLIPGMVGNPESLIEESHENGLLEYPSYTKPAVWRGLEVPPVLLSGNHAEIAKWRHEQQLARTQAIRPDLLPE